MRYLVIVIVSIFFLKCSQSNNCGTETSPTPTVGFFTLNTVDNNTEENPFTVNNLTMYGIQSDTSITDSNFINNENTNNIIIPLNSNTDSTSYVLSIKGDSLVQDTVTVFYIKKLYSRSTECEFVTNFSITNVRFTTDTLSNVIIQDPIVEDQEKTSTTDETDLFYHLKFYF